MLHNLANNYRIWAKRGFFLFHSIAYERICLDAHFDQKLCGATIWQNAPCAHGYEVFVVKFGKNLEKSFYKLKSIASENGNKY